MPDPLARSAEPAANLDPEQAVAHVRDVYDRLREQIHKVIVGQDEVVDQILIAMFCRGHALVQGVPGLAKTLLISTIARTLSLGFSRIQFTPDLMPSDITGTEVIEEDKATGVRELRFVKGPIFANVILADEINRTPPKTQAALLQAMQERRVTAGGRTYPLELPFLVFATQNPIEQEGTYPLPEAQLDRFMFMIDVGYPSEDEEVQVVMQTTRSDQKRLEKVLGPQQILEMQELVLRVPVAEDTVRYAVRLARRTRPKEPDAPDFVQKYVAWGAGPRASQNLILAAKARAILHGRFAAEREDVRALAKPVLRHRIQVNFSAEAEGIRSEDVVDRLLGA